MAVEYFHAGLRAPMTVLRQFREQVASMQLEIGAADVLHVPLHDSYPSIVVQLQIEIEELGSFSKPGVDSGLAASFSK